jgi:hypothetical protein
MFATLVLCAVVALQASSPVPGDSVTDRDIRAAYASLVHVVVVAPPGSTDSIVNLEIGAPPDSNLLAGFYRDHDRWLTYLVLNGRGFTLAGLDDEAPGVARARPGHAPASVLQRDFVRHLGADSQFNSVVVPAIAKYLRHSGIPVMSALPVAAPDTIPLDTAVALAVRFFYPDFIMNGRIMTHVCTVINAVRELPRRNPGLEALAYAAIMGDIGRGDSSRLGADLDPAMRLMNSLDPVGPDSVRLPRAQGIMWGVMARSTRLREVLRSEAQREQDALTFVLAGQ